MKCGVVRALWGDILAKRSLIPAPDYYHGVLVNVRDSVALGEQTDLVCCWGETNLKFCKSLGLSNVILMDKHPYGVCSKKAGKREGRGLDDIIYAGSCIFRHKWQALLKGFECFDVVMSVDWDARQIQKLTSAWWDRQLSFDVPFRGTLRKTAVPKYSAVWREKNSFFLPQCGCILFLSQQFVQQCMKTNEEFPKLLQKQALGKTFDDLHGGWIGLNAYVSLGYEADFFLLNSRRQYKIPEPKNVIWEYPKEGTEA